MFDSVCCSKMNQDSLAQVSSAALFVLKDLLKTESVSVESATIEAQHLSSSSGDADAHTITIHIPSRRAVPPPDRTAAGASGNTSENGPPVGPDAERASIEAVSVQQRTTGGGR